MRLGATRCDPVRPGATRCDTEREEREKREERDEREGREECDERDEREEHEERERERIELGSASSFRVRAQGVPRGSGLRSRLLDVLFNAMSL